MEYDWNKHLSDSEKAFFEAVKEGNTEEVKRLVSQVKIIDQTENQGMTALMFASYRGSHELIELLIECGANVNSSTQKDNYTCLMFAVLSGSTDSVRLLLEAGAQPDAVNCINKTAGQLGAFTGRHDCVSVINNFVQFSDIHYYTQLQGVETEAKLKSHLAKPLHRYIVLPNLNPVRLVLYLQANDSLLDEKLQMDRVLIAICSKSFKSVNEVLAVKTHILNYVLARTHAWREGKEGKGGLSGMLKYLVKGREVDGLAMGSEVILRTSLKSFPYSQSNIFQQLMMALSAPGCPTALSAITQSINGMQSANFDECCACCGERHSMNKCSSCKMVRYCSSSCQKLHWSTHKRFCAELKETHRLNEQLRLQEDEEEAKRKEEKARLSSQKEEELEDGTIQEIVSTKIAEDQI